jgi:hypothetical protein
MKFSSPKRPPQAGSESEKADGKGGEIEASGTTERNLEAVCSELFSKLEDSLVTDRSAFIDDYFVTLAKRDEMAMLWVDPPYYQHLKTIVRSEVLPLYDQYCALRQRTLEKNDKRTLGKYIAYTVGICAVLETLFSEGRVLRPLTLGPALALDALLGWGLYQWVNWRAGARLRAASERLLNAIREIDTKHDVARRYDIFREYSGGELLNAELQELLAAYSKPDEFWRDYCRVRRADPTTETAARELGVPRFASFLELHAKGVYSPEARGQRFNQLFLMAHKAFLLNDPSGYALGHLEGKPRAILD